MVCSNGDLVALEGTGEFAAQQRSLVAILHFE
jgi:hypothetical protein